MKLRSRDVLETRLRIAQFLDNDLIFYAGEVSFEMYLDKSRIAILFQGSLLTTKDSKNYYKINDS